MNVLVGLSMIARGTGGEFSVRGGCRACVMGVLFTVLSHHVVEVYLPALPRSIAAPPSNSCECSVQCAPPGSRFWGVVRSGRVRTSSYACHSSKTVKGRSYQRSLKTTHTYRFDCRNNNIYLRLRDAFRHALRRGSRYCTPMHVCPCQPRGRGLPVRNLMFLVRTLQFLSCYSSSLLQKPQS